MSVGQIFERLRVLDKTVQRKTAPGLGFEVFSVSGPFAAQGAVLFAEHGFTGLESLNVSNRSGAPGFELLYVFYNPADNLRAAMRTEADHAVQSIVSSHPACAPHEREAYDLFGVEFSGIADRERIFQHSDAQGFPLRAAETVSAVQS
ncbi:MAG: NADH-quinone oxidoreductase subunit C [Elusimicrobiaceae bacterium]|nr:NADH-quinone oxidoreductase subunit C [Elusimicrobiaceae bacterium]